MDNLTSQPSPEVDAMEMWQPITIEKLQAIIYGQLPACTPEQRELFLLDRVPFRLAAIERCGKVESVFLVAQRENDVMYYDDVEEGFNCALMAEDGRIRNHSCNQDELEYALQRFAELLE